MATSITSPKGTLQYVQVTGQGKLDYDGKFYEFVASVKLGKKEAEAMYAEVCDYFEENKPSWFKGEKPSNKIKRKQDDGDFLFQFKTKAEFETEDPETKKISVHKTKIGIINSKNKEVALPEGEGIGNGSIGRIKGTLTIHSDRKKGTAGVSLWLNNVQVLKYVKYVPDTGFDIDEDGEFEDFEQPDAEFPTEEDVAKEKPKKKKKKKKKD